MPKLKGALLNQQHAASQLAARKKAAEREKARQGDIRAKAAGVGKGRKKAKRAERRAERQGEGMDGDEEEVDVRGSQSRRGIRQEGDGAGPSAPAQSAVLGGPAGSKSGVSKLANNDADADAGAESASTSTSKDKNNGVTSSKGKDKGKSKAPVHPSGSAGNRIIPFDKDDTLLLLGEANFSFSLSVVTSHKFPPSRILTTSYDPEPICYRKYPDGEGNVAELRRRGVRVEFGVDAGDLARCKSVGKGGGWSRVVFNFPHAGESARRRGGAGRRGWGVGKSAGASTWGHLGIGSDRIRMVSGRGPGVVFASGSGSGSGFGRIWMWIRL